MSPIAIVFGVLLTLLGPLLYILSDPAKQSPTAFIPSAFGIALIVCGVIARKEKARMHAMHGAAFVGLIGFLVPLGRLFYAMTKPEFQFGWAAGGTLAMSALSAIF